MLDHEGNGGSTTDRGEKVGVVTPEERDQIRTLYERKSGLIELVIALSERDELTPIYEKVISDLGRTKMRFSEWWQDTAKKYDWKKDPEGKWEIDFETCEIYLKLKA